MSNWTTGMMEGDTIVFIGSTLPDRSKRSLADESANRQYRIPVDDSIEKMSLTIYTVGEGTTVSDAYVPSIREINNYIYGKGERQIQDDNFSKQKIRS